MILSGRTRARRQADRNRARRRDSASRAGRCAKPSACSRKPAWCAPKRTAASSCATSRSRKPSRSSTCAQPWTSSSADGWPSPSAPRRCARSAALVDAMEQAVRSRGCLQLPPAQPQVPRPSGRIGRQRQAHDDLPQADQGTEPVPQAQPGRWVVDADLRRGASGDRQGDRTRATRTRPARRCSTM